MTIAALGPRTLAVALLALPSLAGGSITWNGDWEAAFERARAEKKVVVLAVNMDGEVANDRMVEKVYRDAQVVELAARTINLVASRFDHAPDGKRCPRFDGIECIDHKRIEGAARQSVLKTDASGYVIAPQHVFLGPDQKVLLSVPYEISALELAWCFTAAIKLVDPETARELAPVGRAPRRLITGAVFDPSGVPGAGLAPPSKEELEALLKEVKASLWGEGRELKILRILMSAEPDAMEYISAELKVDFTGRRGFGGWAPEGNDPRGNRQVRLMHAIGVFSPPVYWKVVVDFLSNDEEALRCEAAVALEQLAAPESVKALLSAVNKEKSAKVKKDLLRALGSAGASEDKARKPLLKSVASEKDPLLRANAIFASGWLSPGADVNKLLAELLSDGDETQRSAAALAMGLSRNESWIEFLTKQTGPDANPQVSPHAEAALKVLRGAGLGELRRGVRAVCQDEIERERIFGVQE